MGAEVSCGVLLTPVNLIKSLGSFELSQQRNQKIKKQLCGWASTWVQEGFFFLFFLLEFALQCSQAGGSVTLWGHELNCSWETPRVNLLGWGCWRSASLGCRVPQFPLSPGIFSLGTKGSCTVQRSKGYWGRISAIDYPLCRSKGFGLGLLGKIHKTEASM